MVEEPGEEPKLYRQDTGELVTDLNAEPFLVGENDEHPLNLPQGKESAKSTTSKMYKDIDDLIEKLKNEDKSSSQKTAQNSTNNNNNTSIHISTASSSVNTSKTNSKPSSMPAKHFQSEISRMKEDFDVPPSPSTTKKKFQKSFNESSFSDKFKSPSTNNNNNTYDLEKETVKGKQSVTSNASSNPSHVQCPSPVQVISSAKKNDSSLHIGNKSTSTNKNNSTVVSSQKIGDDARLNKTLNSLNSKEPLSTIGAKSNLNGSSIQMPSFKKSETLTSPRVMANRNNKDLFVAKNRTRSSSIKSNSCKHAKKSQVCMLFSFEAVFPSCFILDNI